MDKQMIRRLALLGASILLVLASTVSAAQAASLCVNPKGSGGCYNSIQAAVDAAADGDQIIIRAGKYVEQVAIIDKDLTLLGRDGAVVQAFPGMAETLFGATGAIDRPIIGAAHADVTIRGLTIDGMNLSADNLFMDGIALVNAGGVIQNNVIRNVGFGTPTLPLDPTGQPILQGDGIFVLNLSTPRTVTIAGNRILNFNSNGMTLVSLPDPNNPNAANLTLDVSNNTVVGSGPTDVIDQFGILFLSDGFVDPSFFASATIRNNHIHDLVTVPPYPLLGSGIVTFNSANLDISRNEVARVNVALDAAPVFNTHISNNQFSGLGPDDSGSLGLNLSGSDLQVNHNQFRKFETGILLHIQHPFLGSALSTSLNDNEFGDIGVEVLTGVGAPVATGMPNAGARISKLESYRLHLQP